MGEADFRAAAGRVLAALGEAGRSEGTIRRHQAVLDRFAAFLAGRGLNSVSDQVCVDFIAGQTGPGWGRCGSRSGTGMSRRSAGRWC
jgi:integrase/recombinase XerD